MSGAAPAPASRAGRTTPARPGPGSSDPREWEVLAEQLLRQAESPATLSRFEADTDEAIAAGIFGAPSYVVDGEIFWGQDRLQFLERKLDCRARL